jgi:excisionase family DNA binding protein
MLTNNAKIGINDGVKPMQERMFTVQQVAQQLQVSDRTVRNWVERGELRVFRIGKRGYRIAESDLIEFIERRKQQNSDGGLPT